MNTLAKPEVKELPKYLPAGTVISSRLGPILELDSASANKSFAFAIDLEDDAVPFDNRVAIYTPETYKIGREDQLRVCHYGYGAKNWVYILEDKTDKLHRYWNFQVAQNNGYQERATNFFFLTENTYDKQTGESSVIIHITRPILDGEYAPFAGNPGIELSFRVTSARELTKWLTLAIDGELPLDAMFAKDIEINSAKVRRVILFDNAQSRTRDS